MVCKLGSRPVSGGQTTTKIDSYRTHKEKQPLLTTSLERVYFSYRLMYPNCSSAFFSSPTLAVGTWSHNRTMKTETLACSAHLRIVFMFFLPGAQLLILGANVRSWNWLHLFQSMKASLSTSEGFPVSLGTWSQNIRLKTELLACSMRLRFVVS